MPTTDHEDKEEAEAEETITRQIAVLWNRTIKLLSRTDPRASQSFSRRFAAGKGTIDSTARSSLHLRAAKLGADQKIGPRIQMK
jgi:hypothetical protein